MALHLQSVGLFKRMLLSGRIDPPGDVRRDPWPTAALPRSTQPTGPAEGSYLHDSDDPYSNLPSTLPGSFGQFSPVMSL